METWLATLVRTYRAAGLGNAEVCFRLRTFVPPGTPLADVVRFVQNV